MTKATKKIPKKLPKKHTSGLVCGIGIVDRMTCLNGVRLPAYKAWCNMLFRCYSKEFLQKNPTYVGCSVCASWLRFSIFSKWFIRNHVPRYNLDKDILIPGNKIYGPTTCCYVPHYVNCMLLNSGKTRGKYPQGVSWDVPTQSFRAQLKGHLALFDNPEDAHACYLKAKSRKLITEIRALYEQRKIKYKVCKAMVLRAKHYQF